jgi:hypothetical protein
VRGPGEAVTLRMQHIYRLQLNTPVGSVEPVSAFRSASKIPVFRRSIQKFSVERVGKETWKRVEIHTPLVVVCALIQKCCLHLQKHFA